MVSIFLGGGGGGGVKQHHYAHTVKTHTLQINQF